MRWALVPTAETSRMTALEIVRHVGRVAGCTRVRLAVGARRATIISVRAVAFAQCFQYCTVNVRSLVPRGAAAPFAAPRLQEGGIGPLKVRSPWRVTFLYRVIAGHSGE